MGAAGGLEPPGLLRFGAGCIVIIVGAPRSRRAVCLRFQGLGASGPARRLRLGLFASLLPGCTALRQRPYAGVLLPLGYMFLRQHKRGMSSILKLQAGGM